MDPDEVAAIIRDLAQLMGQSDVQREVIEAAANSVIGAMQRVPNESRAELQSLVAEFLADPGDPDVKANLGAMFASAPRAEH